MILAAIPMQKADFETLVFYNAKLSIYILILFFCFDNFSIVNVFLYVVGVSVYDKRNSFWSSFCHIMCK